MLGRKQNVVIEDSACEHAKSLQSCLTLCDHMDCGPPRLLCSWDFPGKNTGVGCVLFQGIFSTQGSNSCLMSPALTDRFFTTNATWKAQRTVERAR